jgi:glycosyltransferase involved in cell wall biosynthesis
MRVVLDMQACQSGSRWRGIGRASRSLAIAMARCLLDNGHEVVCLFSNAFPAEAKQLRAVLEQKIQGLKYAAFDVPSPCDAQWPQNEWRQQAARILREFAIASLEPDFVHVFTLLADGWGDDAVASVGELGIHVPTSLTHHDLIPLVMAETYLTCKPFRDYYERKIESVRRADLLLAISAYSRAEAMQCLQCSPEKVVDISSAVDDDFAQISVHKPDIEGTLSKFGISPGFLLYAPGGFDARKNIDRLIEAYAKSPQQTRKQHQMVLVSKLDETIRAEILQKARLCGIETTEFIVTGYVTEDELVDLYRACHAYVFPSLHEGFGLSVLEAMACGAPVIASNRTSIPEVVGLDAALFDPFDVADMARKMSEVASDADFRARLKAHAEVQVKKFSWPHSARIAVAAIEKKLAFLIASGWRAFPAQRLPSCEALLAKLNALKHAVLPSDEDLRLFRACHQTNCQIGLAL